MPRFPLMKSSSTMAASAKGERPAGSQSQTLFGQAKKEPGGKAGSGAGAKVTPQVSRAAATKADHRPRQAKKKAKAGKPAAKI